MDQISDAEVKHKTLHMYTQQHYRLTSGSCQTNGSWCKARISIITLVPKVCKNYESTNHHITTDIEIKYVFGIQIFKNDFIVDY